jgi:hypothetical protein
VADYRSVLQVLSIDTGRRSKLLTVVVSYSPSTTVSFFPARLCHSSQGTSSIDPERNTWRRYCSISSCFLCLWSQVRSLVTVTFAVSSTRRKRSVFQCRPSEFSNGRSSLYCNYAQLGFPYYTYQQQPASPRRDETDPFDSAKREEHHCASTARRGKSFSSPLPGGLDKSGAGEQLSTPPSRSHLPSTRDGEAPGFL